MFTRSRVVAACAAIALAPAAAACTGSHGKTSSAASDLPQSTQSSSSLIATRWWSNSASQLGSVINSKNPEGAAAQLTVSPTDYCGMLRETVEGGRSILPNVTANDPALLTSTKAFMAELEAVAPSAVAGSWKVVGSAVIAFVKSGGDLTKVEAVDAAAVRKAESTVAADAKRSCGVDLSQAPAK